MTDAPVGEEPIAPVDAAEYKDPEKIVIVCGVITTNKVEKVTNQVLIAPGRIWRRHSSFFSNQERRPHIGQFSTISNYEKVSRYTNVGRN